MNDKVKGEDGREPGGGAAIYATMGGHLGRHIQEIRKRLDFRQGKRYINSVLLYRI